MPDNMHDGSNRGAGRSEAGERHRLAQGFADPNSMDDRRLGQAFEETNSNGGSKPPLKDRIHLPHAPRDRRQRRSFFLVLACLLVVFLIVLLAGWLPRHRRNQETAERARNQQNQRPVVEVERVHRSPTTAGLVLPGTTLPLTEAYLYGRANGYLKARYVDIGDHVRKGQLLAVIDAPDLDQQVDQAREQLRQAQGQMEQQRAQLALATVTVNRYRVLVAKGVFSRQEGDQRETDYSSQLALVAAADRNVEAFRANLRRVQALQSYEFVRAPFAGVITQRNVDVGALISAGGITSGAMSAPAPQGQFSSTGGTSQGAQTNNAGTSGSTSQAATPSQSPGQGGPLFGLAQLDRLRVLVSVPEGYVSAVHTGTRAQLAFQEFPGQSFPAEVTRTAHSVDPNTRTMLTELQVDNETGRLVPGMYTVATLPPGPGTVSPLVVSGDAVVIRNNTTAVAQVENGRIHIVPVVLGRDFGDVVEIESGLREGDLIVTNIDDEVREGAEVKPQLTEAADQKPVKVPPQSQPPGGSTQYGDEGITDRSLLGRQQQQNQKGSGSHSGSKSSGGNQTQKNAGSRSKP